MWLSIRFCALAGGVEEASSQKSTGVRFMQEKHIRMERSALRESLLIRLQFYQFFKAVTNQG